MNKTLVIMLLAGLALRLYLSVQIYSGDVNNHVSWGQDILANGPAGIYQREFYKPYGTMTPTYPPIPLIVFTVSKALYDFSYSTAWALNLKYPIFPSSMIYFVEDQDTQPAFFKIWAIAADIGIAWICYLFTRRLIVAALVLFNPAFFYNSAYWGQIESLPVFFVLAALYLLLTSKRFLLASAVFALGLISKQSAIIFIPVFFIALLKTAPLKTFFQGTLLTGFLIWLSFLPFYKFGNLLFFPLQTYINKIQTGSGSDYITDHAFNFWALTTGLNKISDSTPALFNISYGRWGYILFGAIAVFTPILLVNRPLSAERVFLACSLISTGAFLFLTRMHGRYLESALPFVLLSAAKHKFMYIIFVFLSGFYFLNLYHNWWAPRIPVLVNFISSLAVINSLIVLSLFSFTVLAYRYART